MKNNQPQVAAVVLAAGLSTRMGNNKLLADIGGEPLVRRVVGSVEKSRARPIVVVTGSDHERVEAALAGTEAVIVYNPDFRHGLGTSLRAGIGAAGECDGAIIVLGDMPAISTSLIDRMITALDLQNGRAICVATRDGRRGNPAAFDRSLFGELLSISGDIGARHVIARHADLVCEVEAGDDGPLIDIDTPEELKRFRDRP